MTTPPLHPNVEPLAFLLGTWTGRGHGVYPTIESFDYDETITFGHAGKPFLAYNQRTTAADDGRPLHAEAGLLAHAAARGSSSSCSPTRPASSRSKKARSTTMELHATIRLRSTIISRTSTAKEVVAVERDFTSRR